MNPESRDGLPAAVEEHVLIYLAVIYQERKFDNGLRPQWAAPELVAFAAHLNQGMVTRGLGQREIGDFGLCRLVSACTRIVKE
jgi:hypothetical protein